MWNIVSAVGTAAYKTAAKSGLAAGSEQPPYPCALPLQQLSENDDPAHVQELLDSIFEGAKDLLHGSDQQWSLVDYRDPDEGGDLFLFTRPHIGPYNFARATMSFMNCTPERILETMHGEEFEMRQKFSANLSQFAVLAHPTPTSNVQYHEYWAPPPVASREFVYLVEKKYVKEEDTYYVYGCSVDYKDFKKKTRSVRASCMWAWELMPVGDSTMATYVSVLNPNGWAPTFLVGWMKAEIAKELVSIRHVLYGLAANTPQIPVDDQKEKDDARQEEGVKLSSVIAALNEELPSRSILVA